MEQEKINLSLDNLILQVQVLVTAWNFGGIDKTGYKDVVDYVKDKLNYPKQIDEEELDKLAEDFVANIDEHHLDEFEQPFFTTEQMENCFKAGCEEILKRTLS